MTGLLLWTLLCAAPDISVSSDPLVPAEVFVAPEPDRPKRREVFFAPFATGAALAAGAVDEGGLYLPLGATFSLGPHWGLTTELSAGVPVMFKGRIDNPGWSLSTAVGPTFFWQREGLEGFFVTPKLVFQVASPATSTALPEFFDSGIPLDAGPGISRTFLAAADVGYRWRWRSFTLGVVLGAGVGYGWDRLGSLVTPLPRGRAFARTGGIAYLLDLDVLRVGYAF